MWSLINEVEVTSKFRSLYKKKLDSSPKHIVEKIDSAMIRLRCVDRPEALGEYKRGNLKGTLALKINSETRILYRVEREDGHCRVSLLRVCSHKQTYGKD